MLDKKNFKNIFNIARKFDFRIYKYNISVSKYNCDFFKDSALIFHLNI